VVSLHYHSTCLEGTPNFHGYTLNHWGCAFQVQENTLGLGLLLETSSNGEKIIFHRHHNAEVYYCGNLGHGAKLNISEEKP
jgi:hypothetical protein